MAYDVRITAALSGATRRQLDHWRRTELLVPEISAERTILYSFKDLVALRTIVYLRQWRVLPKIREALKNLRRIGEREHLSKYVLIPQGDKAITLLRDDDSIELVEHPGHYVTAVVLDQVIRPFPLKDGNVVPDLFRPRPRISAEPEIRCGHPVITGTRVPFERVAGLVRDGVPLGEVSQYYAAVSRDDARDAVNFADWVDIAERRQAA